MANNDKGKSREELEEELRKLEDLSSKFIQNFVVSGTKLTLDGIKVNIKKHANKDELAPEFFRLCTVGYVDTKQGRISLEAYANRLRPHAGKSASIRLLISYGESIYRTQQALNALAREESQRAMIIRPEEPKPAVSEKAETPPIDKAIEKPMDKFESIALMLDPAKRKEIGDAVDNLKTAKDSFKKTYKALTEEQRNLMKNLEYNSTEKDPMDNKSADEKIGKHREASNSVQSEEDALKEYLVELQRLRTKLDQGKPLSQTGIQKIMSYLGDIFALLAINH